MTLLARAPASVLALILPVVGLQAAPSAARPTVPCSAVIGHAKGGRSDGYRVVLGRVSVPPPLLRQVVAVEGKPWAYWRKAGLVVLAGSTPVDVEVAPAWRRRAAITWGSSGIVGSLRVAACPHPAGVWNAYAGGFYLRGRSACVPLVFRIGSRAATVRFGVGRACP